MPVALHWDGTALSTRPVHGPGVRADPSDEFGLVAIGPDETLMTIDKGVVRWDGGGWADTDLKQASSMDVPLIMEQGTTGVWAKVWNTGCRPMERRYLAPGSPWSICTTGYW